MILSAAYANEPGESVGSSAAHEDVLAQQMGLMSERFQLRHRLKYTDPDYIPLRQEARSRQHALQQARDNLDQYVRTRHPEFRARMRAVNALYEAAREGEELVAVLERELRLSMRRPADDPEAQDEQATLQQELEQAREQAVSYRQQAQQAARDLRRQQASFAEQSGSGRELLEQFSEAEAAFEQAHHALHHALDQHPEVQALDTRLSRAAHNRSIE